MADFLGEVLVNSTQAVALPGISPNVAYSWNPAKAAALLDSLSGRADAPAFVDRDALLSPEPLQSFSATQLGLFEELFEKVVLTPRSKACGFVLADVTWQTNIWNTHRNTICTLLRCDVQDSGNVAVINPLGYPLSFAPFQGRDLTTIVPRDGDATIQAVLTFVVPGESGTDVTITGSRIVVFPADADWTDPVKERTQYLTDILAGYTAKEQRIALRKRPRTHLAFRVMPTERATAAAIEALLYGWQARVFGVPFWPDAMKITQALPVNSSTISCDTSNRKFAAGGLVMLWRDFFTNEVATIASVAAGSVTTTAPVNNSWAADGFTYAVPVLTGRWDGDASPGRLSPSAFELDAAFQCDAFADVAAAVLPQVYGNDVLEIEPNAVQDRSSSYTRTIQVFDSATSKSSKVTDRSGVAISTTKGFLWTLGSRAEIAAYRAWLALRKGRRAPFWLPTWQHDLIQAADVVAGGTTLVIQKTGYTKYQFSQAARRYLCFTMLNGSGTRYYRHVTGAQENATTETLVLDSALSSSASVAAGSCMISFLLLVRLASDEPELSWYARDVAEVSLEMIELPLEVNP